MKTFSLVMSLLLAATSASQCVNAQEALQRKGVSYWGQPGAQKLYAQPPAGQRAGADGLPAWYTQGSPAKPGAAAPPAAKRPSALQRYAKSTFNFEVMTHGLRRDAIVHLPSNYDPKKPTPVILAFHGLGMTGAMMPPLTLLDLSADRYGFITVYPDALNRRWDSGFYADSNDDVGFIQDLIKQLPRAANIDIYHIYACGISDGGYFAQRVACDLPNEIKAIGVIASASVTKVCARCGSPRTPVVFFMGTDDPLVPREGDARAIGAIGEVLGVSGALSLDNGISKYAGINSASETIDYWLRRNGVSSSPRTTYYDSRNDGCKVKLEDYGGGGGEVAIYTIEGGGHTWPGGIGVAPGVMGRTTQDVNASDILCDFFKRH